MRATLEWGREIGYLQEQGYLMVVVHRSRMASIRWPVVPRRIPCQREMRLPSRSTPVVSAAGGRSAEQHIIEEQAGSLKNRSDAVSLVR